MELREYIILFRRWIWLLLLGSILGSCSSFVASYFQEPVYQTSAKVFVSQPSRETISELGYITGNQLLQTYAQLMTTDPIIDATNERSQTDWQTEISAGDISVQQIRDTQLLLVTVEHSNPQWVQLITNTLIEVFIEHQYASQTSRFASSKENLAENLNDQNNLIDSTAAQIASLGSGDENAIERDRLEANLAQYRATYANLLQSYETLRITEAQSAPIVELVEPAQLRTTPIRPRPVQNTILGFVVGLMIAGGIVFLIEYLDDTIKNPEEVAKLLELPVIGYVIEVRNQGKKHINQIYVAKFPRSPIAEAFRTLRTNLEFAGAANPLKTILVTSPGAGEGKTTIAANLAVSMGQGGKSVAMVDADLRRPRIHRLMGIKNRVGLGEYFTDRSGVEDISQISIVNKNLITIPSGKLPPNPTELLDSEKMTRLMEKLSEVSDYVIFDSPPLLVADPLVLASKVDGVLLVVQPGRTSFAATKNSVEQLNRAGARVVGITFNRITRSHAYYYRNYYPNYYFGSSYYSEDNGNQ
ncbi:MAG: polysaccharide biosynthesis tyrosine autokinase [Chloroflexi bacterium]|nr:polysaccharide biosynthesis tyrosine autokinase [Chloroflexota bacterium]